ncbi:MAG: ATP-grasp domain-containing protein, partial [Bdellovibrionota bacterium]
MKALLLFPFAPNKLARFIMACESDSVQLEIVANQNLTEGLPPNAIMTTETALSFAELSQSVSSLETYDGFVPFSEFSVVLTDQVAQALGKPCNAIKDLECLTNKYAMRKSFENTGVLQPKVLKFLKRDEEIDKESLEQLTFPVVVKPTDAAGSLNVKIVHSPEEVKTAIENIRSFLYWKDAEVKFSGDAIIEEAIGGQEFSTEVIVQDAKVLFQSNTFKVMSAWPSTDELGHVLP